MRIASVGHVSRRGTTMSTALLDCCRLGACALAAIGLVACGENARLPPTAGEGAHPTLPEPAHTLIPTVHVAPATGWPAGKTPVAANGMRVSAFSTGLQHPR